MPYLAEPTRRELCRVIDALLDDGPISTRLSNAIRQFSEIDEINLPPAVQEEFAYLFLWLSDNMNDFVTDTRIGSKFTDKEERELTDRLFSLYTDISGGGIIF